jgi:hypothetical protein
MFKKIAIAFIILLVLIVGAANYLWSNLDSIVKHAIEKYGTAATQTDVTLSGVKISLTSGEGSLSGLAIANPKGFSSAKAFEMGSISVALDIRSIEHNPVTIRETTIEKPQVTYEVAVNGNSNLQTIEHNATNYAAAVGGNQSAGKNNSASGGEERKIIINDLYIRGGEIQITSALLQGRTLKAPLPLIHLTNIGKNSGGATPAQVAQQIIQSITSSAINVASSELAKQIPELKNLPAGGAIGSTVKGLLGR